MLIPADTHRLRLRLHRETILPPHSAYLRRLLSTAIAVALLGGVSSVGCQTNTTTPKSSRNSTALFEDLAALDGRPLEDNSDLLPGTYPIVRGLNASMVTSSQHDTSAGWSSQFEPNVSFRFNRHFSVNVDIPVFTYLLTSQVVNILNKSGTVTGQETVYHTKSMVFGDTAMTGEFELHPRAFDYDLAVTVAAPTGDYINGVGAGVYTFAINNRFERSARYWLTPDLELGICNSSNLNNPVVHKSYTDVGTNAHFQVGLGFNLLRRATFTAEAYEDLPLGTQTVISTTIKGKKGKQTTVTTTSQESLGEDNGFLSALRIPLSRQVTLTGFYNRSLRDHDDTVGFSFTFLFRTPRQPINILE